MTTPTERSGETLRERMIRVNARGETALPRGPRTETRSVQNTDRSRPVQNTDRSRPVQNADKPVGGRPQFESEHGSERGYQQHRYDGTPRCAACKKAHADHNRRVPKV